VNRGDQLQQLDKAGEIRWTTSCRTAVEAHVAILGPYTSWIFYDASSRAMARRCPGSSRRTLTSSSLHVSDRRHVELERDLLADEDSTGIEDGIPV
jgi:hypothetical protein